MAYGRCRGVHHFIEGFVQLLAPSRCVACEEPCAPVFCEACEALLEPAATPGAVFQYGGPIADAIHRFKYRGRSDLAEALGSLMARAAIAHGGEIDAVVPVPLHWRRRRWRGYDQAALLARPIARSLGVPVLVRGLRRTRHTPSQIDLPHKERRRNVAGAFAPYRVRGAARVLLIDDVRTTGATLEAARSALRAGGVAEVRSLVLATRLLR
jgi:ComF family protein